jgi:hypothetical protein
MVEWSKWRDKWTTDIYMQKFTASEFENKMPRPEHAMPFSLGIQEFTIGDFSLHTRILL